MNDIRTSQITHDKKKKIYDSINEIFQKRYNDRSKLPMYLSYKIFKPTHGEKEADLYTNRSIYILKNKCKNECNMDCLSATELLNPKLGLNIIHKILKVNKVVRRNSLLFKKEKSFKKSINNFPNEKLWQIKFHTLVHSSGPDCEGSRLCVQGVTPYFLSSVCEFFT